MSSLLGFKKIILRKSHLRDQSLYCEIMGASSDDAQKYINAMLTLNLLEDTYQLIECLESPKNEEETIQFVKTEIKENALFNRFLYMITESEAPKFFDILLILRSLHRIMQCKENVNVEISKIKRNKVYLRFLEKSKKSHPWKSPPETNIFI